MEDCAFCRILAGKGPVSYVHRDETTAAFMDINPINPGQVVVIPRVHAQYLGELDEPTTEALFRTTTRVCAALRRSGIPLDGFDLFLADGEAAGQEVFHVHVIVIPRSAGDSLILKATPDHPTRDTLDERAAELRDAYQSLFPAA